MANNINMTTSARFRKKPLILRLRKVFGNGNRDTAPMERSISRTAWIVLAIISVGTFLAFMVLDPNPNLLLSVCAAANAGIILWAIYRLYSWNLLLSPMASVVIGPGWIFYYSWGNLGARMAGSVRLGGNLGSLEYYSFAALLTTFGLALFYWLIFDVFSRHARYRRIRYEDLFWKPWQALAAGTVASGILLYLSYKYEFINGYFRDVEGHFDRWLSASHYFFVILVIIISISVIIRGKNLFDRSLGMLGILLPVVVSIGLRSRTFMMTIVLTAALCFITLRPHKVRPILIASGLVAIFVFGIGTVVKQASTGGETSSISDNIMVAKSIDRQLMIERNLASAEIDNEYRLAGYEYPATILMCLYNGQSPMYGSGFVGGLFSGLPAFIRPSYEISERLEIYKHFFGRGLIYGDSIGIPLTSGLADWGIGFSPFIYAVMALYCLVVWRLVQASPRLFVAYLIAGAGIGDLFWENAFFAVRAIGFAWLALLIFGRILMPRWAPPPLLTNLGSPYQRPNDAMSNLKLTPPTTYGPQRNN
jgi:hypothetical protein